MPFLQGEPGRRGCGGAAVGAGHRGGDHPEGDRWLPSGLASRGCGTVTFAEPPPGAHRGSVSYGPVLNAAAVLLSCCGNVPPERAARVMGMLLGIPVSAGWVDKAAARVAAQLGKAGSTRRCSRRWPPHARSDRGNVHETTVPTR
jgi:hypothetical protein